MSYKYIGSRLPSIVVTMLTKLFYYCVCSVTIHSLVLLFLVSDECVIFGLGDTHDQPKDN